MVRILFVCLGNICRSPTARGVFDETIRRAGLSASVASDSCGTAGYHVGEEADPRTVTHARRRGYDLETHRARQLAASDFERFDLVVAMDRRNLDELHQRCPPVHRHKLALFLSFGDDASREVPDPYYGGPEGFDRVIDLCEEGSAALLAHLRDTGRV